MPSVGRPHSHCKTAYLSISRTQQDRGRDRKALCCMSNLIVDLQCGVDVPVCICKSPNKPSYWPGAVMCLKQNVGSSRSRAMLKSSGSDFLCARRLSPAQYGTTTESSEWRCQVGGSSTSLAKSTALKCVARFHADHHGRSSAPDQVETGWQVHCANMRSRRQLCT